MQKDINTAVVFLRDNNSKIPSEVIEFMKQASLRTLKKIESKAKGEMSEEEVGQYADIMRKNGVNTEAMTWSQIVCMANAMRDC